MVKASSYNNISKNKSANKMPSKTEKFSSTSTQDSNILGSCPVCSSNVIENDKAYHCTNYNNCKFAIFKNDKYLASFKKKPNKTMVKSILKKGNAKVKSLTSKKGTKFDATLSYTQADNGYFSWNMHFDKYK